MVGKSVFLKIINKYFTDFEGSIHFAHTNNIETISLTPRRILDFQNLSSGQRFMKKFIEIMQKRPTFLE
jgi:alpha-D-ribose 1-methylphosphonate 5-triphosphate synthase subunit PhnL